MNLYKPVFFTTLFIILFAASSLPGFALFETWDAVEDALDSDRENAVDTIDAFIAELQQWKASLASKFYIDSGLSPDASIATIINDANDLAQALQEAALHNDDASRTRITQLSTKIRNEVKDWRNFDNRVLQEAQNRYFYHFITFIILMALLVLALYFVYRAWAKAEFRAGKSAAAFRDASLAQELERKRISFELHDSVIPEIRAISGRLAKEERIALEETMMNLRSICRELTPPDFKRLAFGDALAQLGRDFMLRSGIECRMRINEKLDTGALSPEDSLNSYRIVQEALHNCEKHSGSKTVFLWAHNRNTNGKNYIHIGIQDDGIGIPALAPHHLNDRFYHFGINNMKERAALIHSSLELKNIDGGGLLVTLIVPIDETETTIQNTGGGWGGLMHSIIIIEDHELMRRGLRDALEGSKLWEVRSEASNYADAEKLITRFARSSEKEKKVEPDVILLDITLKNDNGLDLIALIRKEYVLAPAMPRILVYTMHEDYAHLHAALQAGATGYISKTANDEELLKALNDVLHNKKVVSEDLMPHILNATDALHYLTRREKEIFLLVQEGADNKAIAQRLGISKRTIENHLSIIYDKLGVFSRNELAGL
ncbi:MAG: response regulator [Spirochaetaceae bacterium]|jgi:DNA-binding NarL/FixJ family response regulator/signal transduction histidine kinase|nr:response regulator [Spirochaetaceae bacterium]